MRSTFSRIRSVSTAVLVAVITPAALAADRILMDEEFERPHVVGATSGQPIPGWTWTVGTGTGTHDVWIEPQGTDNSAAPPALAGTDGRPTGQYINPLHRFLNTNNNGTTTLSTANIGSLSGVEVSSEIYRRTDFSTTYRVTISDSSGALAQVNAPPNQWWSWLARSVEYTGAVNGPLTVNLFSSTTDLLYQRSFAIDQVRVNVTSNLARWTGASPYADASRLTDGMSAIQGVNTIFWDDRQNWEQGGKPSAGDDVVFAGGTYTQIAGNGSLQTLGTIPSTQGVMGSASAVSIGSLTLGTASEDMGAAVDAFSLTVRADMALAGALSIHKNDALTLNAGALSVGTTTYLGVGSTLTVGDGIGDAGTASLSTSAIGTFTNVGTLILAGDDALVNVGNGLTNTGSIQVNAGVMNAASIDSTGAFAVSGTGGLNLTGTNTFATLTNGGTMYVRGGSSSVASDLASSGSLIVGDGTGAAGSAALAVQGGLTSSGNLLVQDDGRLTVTGALAAQAGSISSVNGGSLVTDSLALDAGATLTVGDGTGAAGTAILRVQGGLTNTGAFTMAGADASATVSGLFASSAGSTLVVNAGRLSADSMSVSGMATLTGGRLDVATNIMVTSNGRFDAAGGVLVAPIVVNHGIFNHIAGVISSDTFTNNSRLNLFAGSSALIGNFNQSQSGTLILDCNSSTALMTVANTAHLDGRVSFINTDALAFTEGSQVFVDIVGSKTGEFQNVKDGSVIYRAGVANYVYSSHLGDGNDIGLEIKYTDFHGIGQALVPALDTSLAMTRSVMDIQSDRLWTARQDGLLRNPSHTQANQATALDDIDAGPMDAAYDAKEEWSFYALAKGTKMDLDVGAKSDLMTAAAGCDWRPSKSLLVGVLGGYSDGHYSQGAGSGEQTGLTLAAYAAWEFQPSFWLDAQLGYSRLDLDTRREMIGGTLTGSTSGSSLAYGGRVVWQAMDRVDAASGITSRLAPFVGVRFADIQLDGFTEQGPQSTRVAGLDAATWEASAGVQWSQLFPQRTISYSTWGYHLRAELFTGDSSGGTITTTDLATSATLAANQWGGVGSGYRGTAGLHCKSGGWGFSADLTRSQSSEATSWSMQVQVGYSW